LGVRIHHEDEAFPAAKQRVIRARSREELYDALGGMRVGDVDTRIALLTDGPYFSRLLMELSQIASTDVVRAPKSDHDLCSRLLAHGVMLTSGLDSKSASWEAGKLARPLEELASVLCRQLLRAVQEVLLPRAQSTTEQPTFFGHGVLAANDRLQLAVTEMLRMAVGMLYLESAPKSLLDYEWQELLALLIGSSVASLRRLALSVALIVLPHACMTKRRMPIAKAVTSIVNRLEFTSAVTASVNASSEIKTILWIMAELTDAPVWGEDQTARTVESSARQCLSHVDRFVQAAAWRLLRKRRTLRVAAEGAPTLEDISLFATAVRSLEGATSEADKGRPVEENLLHAEIFDFITSMLEVLSACDAEKHKACFNRVFESGILVSPSLRACMASQHVGCQRSFLRLLGALLKADAAVVRGAMLQEAVWPRMIDELHRGWSDGSEPHGSSEKLATAALVADFLKVLRLALGEASQLLLWLFSSTDIAEVWLMGLRALVDASEAGLSDGSGLQDWAAVAQTHLQALQLVVDALQRDGVGTAIDLTCWGAVVSFLRHSLVWQFGSDALRSMLPSSVTRLALSVISDLCTISLAGMDLSSSDIDIEEALGRRACALFHRCASPGHGEESLSSAELPLICYCLSQLLQTSATVALVATEEGLLHDLTAQISLHSTTAVAPAHRSQASKLSQTLVWNVRVLSSMLLSSFEVWTQNAEELLVAAARDLSLSAEKDEAVCLELLSMCTEGLLWQGFMPLQVQEPQAMVSRRNCSRRFMVCLLKADMLEWIMKLSLRRAVSTSIYCKSLEVLSLCSEGLSGKPVLRRYLTKVAETLRRDGRTCGRGVEQDEAVARFVASLNFVASLSLSAGCLALLTSAAPGSQIGDPDVLNARSLGMDFWLDLIDVDVTRNHTVRAASLRVMLSMVLSESPMARTYLTSSERAAKLLALQATRQDEGFTSSTALAVLWVLIHQNQRMVPLIKRAAGVETFKLVKAGHLEEAENDWGRLAVQQVNAVLCTAV